MTGKKFLIVFGHGRVTSLGSSLLDFIAQDIEQLGSQCRIHSLLDDGFDPVLRLAEDQPIALPPKAEQDPLAHRYCQDVLWADVLVFLHPVWWFSMPAILKGWIDRVLVEGVAVTQEGGGSPRGLFQDKAILVIQTFGTKELVEKTVFRQMARKFWQRAVVLPTGAKAFRYLSLHSCDQLSSSKISRFRKEINEALLSLNLG